MPPPTPWMTRKRISSVEEFASPQSAEAAVNRASDTRYTCLAPNRSAAQPLTGMTAASESM